MVFDGTLFQIDQIQSASTITEKAPYPATEGSVTRVRVYFIKGGSVALDPRWKVEDFSAFLAAAIHKKLDTITVGHPTHPDTKEK
jgi:hypothetical protein